VQLKKLDNALILIFILAALLVRVPFLFIVPMVEAPDEYAHFWVTKFLSENFTAPDAAQVAAGGPSAVYGSLPPFAYLPHVLFSHLIPGVDISFSERIGSILGGLVTVFAACRISALLFASNRALRLALPLCVVLHPQFGFVNAYCNSDSTACAFASLLIWTSLVVIFRGPELRYAAFAGILCAFIALSKFSALAIVPVIFFAIIASCWIYKKNAVQTVASLGLTALTAALICVPWFARNAAVFHGDWLGTITMRDTWAKTFNRSIEPVSLSSVLKQKVWWQQLFCSFWAVFGYQKHYLPAGFYLAYLSMILISSAGTFTQISQAVRARSISFDFLRRLREGDDVRLKHQAAWLSLWVCVAFSCAGLLYAAVQNLGGPQGRYLFPSEIAFMAIILSGLYEVNQKWGTRLVFAFIGLNGVTLIYSMILLYSMFGVRIKPY
jgi:4-amino-4-deoxy-L-arabinose transferase-like glycosyltransferase